MACVTSLNGLKFIVSIPGRCLVTVRFQAIPGDHAGIYFTKCHEERSRVMSDHAAYKH